MFRAHLRGPGDLMLAAIGPHNELVGYSVARVVMDAGELFNIAVDGRYRGVGLGGVLLDRTMSWSVEQGAQEMWLEVRASNSAAIRLYGTRGFTRVGLRRAYYAHPVEDALVLRATLPLALPPTLPSAAAGNALPQREDNGLHPTHAGSILSSTSQPTRQETE